jgi:8-amino-7-oxononanoate synthase
VGCVGEDPRKGTIMKSLEKSLSEKLEFLKTENQLRQLSAEVAAIDFSSNDYLGLARSEDLFKIISEKSKNCVRGKNGATGSRLLSGNDIYVQEVESKLATIFNSEAALIFNSGYSANQAVLSSLPQRGDTILYDELAHACIKDGARLSLASRFSFKHNDVDDLEKKLKKSKGKIFIAVEAIYSMDGDHCPLKEIVNVAQNYEASILLDEAHSTGVFGKQGSGLAVSLGLSEFVDIRIHTFGKAMGIHGACVAGSKNLINYLINFARPFIYTTALPPHSIVSIDCAFDYLNRNIHVQKKLNENINLFLANSHGIELKPGSQSAIQTIVVPGNKQVKSAATKLQQAGFDIRPILSPTVKTGSERIRICIHSFNTEQEISQLTGELKKAQTHFANN